MNICMYKRVVILDSSHQNSHIFLNSEQAHPYCTVLVKLENFVEDKIWLDLGSLLMIKVQVQVHLRNTYLLDVFAVVH